MFENKSILVTGGTGSFGKRFISTLLSRHRPERVVVFSRDELKQFEMSTQAPFASHAKTLRYFIGDIRDLPRLERAMEGIDIVVHAAALKQVPAAEYNPFEAVKTNIIGGQNVIDACFANNVQRVVALSTDKAAAPINLYGATKLCSDKLFVAANNYRGKRDIRFSVVRYGNVLGSRGSVVELFSRMVAEGVVELPITDPRMTRFWITLQQGVDFVLKAFERMHGGELFVPKIPSARITDLAQAIAPNIAQRFIGIRPGEKLHELMISHEDSHNTLEFADHYVITPAIRFTESSDYSHNACNERGQRVSPGFVYASDSNPVFLGPEQISELIGAMRAEC